jgi:hemolysin activation/secretion protein
MFAGVCRIVAALAMVSISSAAIAQIVPPSDLPGRERERFQLPTPPLAQPGGAPIAVQGAEAPPGADKVTLVIRRIQVVGSTVYGAEELAALYQDLVGRTVTLQAVYDAAQRITTKYGADGYVLSRAIVPPQELDPKGADVRIQVVEGYVEKVEWPPALSQYVDFFSDYAARITAQRPANIRTIERYLLLAADLPGLKFKNSLKPHPSKQGAAILVVEVTEKPADVFARTDNRGTHARGPGQFLISPTVNNLLRIHDAFTLTYAGAYQTRELQYAAGNYRQVLTSEGLTAFANASYGWGRPGTTELQLLEYKTKSFYAETGLSYPIIRARERNLIVSALWFWTDDRSSFFDMPETPPSTLDKMRGFRIKFDADSADPMNGINQLNFAFSHGFRGLGSTANGDELASRVNGRVDFSKAELTLSRLQPFGGGWSILIAGYGQWAFTPLLVSELCSFGGRLFGRGFDPSQYVGDTCIDVFGELRLDIPHQLQALTQLQLYGFIDHGWLHNLAPVLGTPTNVDAASGGAGLRLGWLNSVTADFTVTRVIKKQPLSVAQAIQQGVSDGLPPDNRFFVILTGRL